MKLIRSKFGCFIGFLGCLTLELQHGWSLKYICRLLSLLNLAGLKRYFCVMLAPPPPINKTFSNYSYDEFTTEVKEVMKTTAPFKDYMSK